MYLPHNNIGPAGAKSLATALKPNTTDEFAFACFAGAE